MKHVTFEVAMRLKELGYPQVIVEYMYLPDGRLVNTYLDKNDVDVACRNFDCAAPTYFEVWCWLCDEKDYHISIEYEGAGKAYASSEWTCDGEGPEEALKNAIDNLIETCRI